MGKLKVELDFAEFGIKSRDVKILAKELDYGHWMVYTFNNVINGNRYVESQQVSCDSIYSPCSKERTIIVDNSNKKEMNDLYIRLQKEEGYKFLGNFEQDIFGGYRRK